MSRRQQPAGGDVLRLQPYEYLHVLDNNTNIARLIVGPTTFTRCEHEEVITQPKSFLTIPPMHYCTITNPVLRDDKGDVLFDEFGAAKCRLGDEEIRFACDPFPLYPQEEVAAPGIKKLPVLKRDSAFKLQALRDFEVTDAAGKKCNRVAGDMYLFRGPGTYLPRVEEVICEEMTATVVLPGEGLRLRALIGFTDRTGVQRCVGDEWLYEQPGAYLCAVEELVVEKVSPIVLTEKVALHLEAVKDFTDRWGTLRKAGEQWLITSAITESFLKTPEINVIKTEPISILQMNEWCVVLNAWDSHTGQIRLGHREVREGPACFFLKPGERLEAGIQPAYVLGENEAVLVRARGDYTATEDGKEVFRKAGNRWMIYGPTTFVPKEAQEVIEKRSAIPLAEDEGLYVRDTKTGRVTVKKGKTYMLEADEELWEKELPKVAEDRLMKQGGTHMAYIEDRGKKTKLMGRIKSRLVSYQLPHNALAQVYNYTERRARIIFGPDLVQLDPDEEFQVMSLSGSEWIPSRPEVVMPKKSGMINTLFLFMGPESMSDVMEVETADHARLKLQLSFSWHFDVKKGDFEAAKAVFNIPDFVGDACSQLQSRIRAAVAAETFDMFHRNSAQIITVAVFGCDDKGEPRQRLYFKANRLVIDSVDIQQVECIDVATKESLQKSVKLAIEITTASQEQAARQTAQVKNQIAKGELERQILLDKSEAEKERKILLEYLAESAAIESTGASKAEAKANAEKMLIEGDSEVKMAELKAQARELELEAELDVEAERRGAELAYLKVMNEMEIEKASQMAAIETGKFQKCVGSVGRDTIAAMARAGPEMQAKLLKGLGLQGYLMTDGQSPINLMNAASSLVPGGVA